MRLTGRTLMETARRGQLARRGRGAAALAVMVSFAGCQVTEDTGFVEIKRQFSPPAIGSFRINGEDVPGFTGPGQTATAVLRQKTGPVRIEFYRDGQSYALCRFDLKKNRIVSATLFLDSREIKCSIQS